MISLEEARAYVMDACGRRPKISTKVSEALGLVTAEDVIARESLPPFANTAMDGFAVRSEDLQDTHTRLRVVETIAAGHNPQKTLHPGEASRIMTGAPVPVGADAIVMVEKTSVDGDWVTVEGSVTPGNHIRPVGDDVAANDLVFSNGSVLSAGHLGVLCSLGINEIATYPRPRVGVISTGDELVDDGRDLEPGQIRDSNRRTLLSLARGDGFDPVDLGLIPDIESEIEAALLAGIESCDAIITSGGVSMGDYDYVKAVLTRIADMRWMQIAIKPAKPLAFGTVGETPIFGLPGNPVSSMVSYELFARPGLRSMMGFPHPVRTSLKGVAAGALTRKADGKIHYARVTAEFADGDLIVTPMSGQGSHMLASMARANALAVLPDGEGCKEGETVQVLLLD